MIRLCLALIPVSFLLSLLVTRIVRGVSARAGAHDTAPVAGQIKEAPRRVPNTGGIGIFVAIALPMLALLLFLAPAQIDLHDWNLVPADLHEHMAGLKAKAGDAAIMLACLLGVHLLGVFDDRRPMGPWIKLCAMLIAATVMVVITNTRLLTMLDGHVGGSWLSVILTVLWIGAITNALNFLDNMDGLAGGVALVASSMFLWAALAGQQWFVAACFALAAGATAGFLVFNFPWRGSKGRGASIFMGDGGSLVLGLFLAFLSVRLTYARIGGGDIKWAGEPGASAAWYGVLMPLAALAVPVYDMAAVTVIRLRQGRSPFVGDLNHLSHRLVRRGLSRRAAVVVICCFTAITGLCGVLLLTADSREALITGVLVALLMTTLALVEFAGSESGVQTPPGGGGA
ncbi:MAG TPA: MraY family glycosyltransferase [Phycisphaerales bacterium]|nr:MraY family glycosyltransferase [Phycisphaerales bacterium]